MVKEEVKDEVKEDKITEEDKLKQNLQEVTELLQRNQAEFDNFRKRIEKEKVDLIKSASKDLIIRLLPLLDNFELALKSNCDGENFVKGIEMIYSQLYQTLEEEGLQKIEKDQFDPMFHEPLLVDTDKSRKNEAILEELQKGYMLNGNVLRHAKVKINKKEGK